MTTPPDPSPVPEWNPLETLAPQRIPLKVSGGRAAVLYRRWSGRERLAYEDALTVKFLTPDAAGGDTVLLGSMRLYAVALTVVGTDGFPGDFDVTMSHGSVEEKIANLLLLDPATMNEIRDTALKVQPLPRADDGLEDKGTDAAEDPSPTPPTPAATRVPVPPVDGSGYLIA